MGDFHSFINHVLDGVSFVPRHSYNANEMTSRRLNDDIGVNYAPFDCDSCYLSEVNCLGPDFRIA
jgi:hypothetical protein